MVFALAGDSTITKFFCISIFCWLEIGCKLTQIINVRSISVTKKAFFPIHYIYSHAFLFTFAGQNQKAIQKYGRDKAHYKLGNVRLALNSYLQAIEINPESPAQAAYDMAIKVLDFYNKDMYNH